MDNEFISIQSQGFISFPQYFRGIVYSSSPNPKSVAEALMPVIHPSLFTVMKRFPDHKDALRQKYRTDKSFRSICKNYQKCSNALSHWTKSEDEDSPTREKEYTVLLHELELEILKSLNGEF
jgi:hypothetical protein